MVIADVGRLDDDAICDFYQYFCGPVYVTATGCSYLYLLFQAEDGIRDRDVTGVQTCALPIFMILDQRIIGLPFL